MVEVIWKFREWLMESCIFFCLVSVVELVMSSKIMGKRCGKRVFMKFV